MKSIIKTGIAMLLLAVVLIALSAGFMRAHAGVVANENRPVEAQVVNIVMSGSIDLVLQQANTPSMVIKGDASMLSRVTSKIEGNTLFLGTRGLIITTRQPLVVELSLPNLEKLQMQGSGDSTVKGFRGNFLNMETRGSGDLRFEGEYQQVKAISAGSGDIKLVVLNNDKLEITLQGSGDAFVKGQSKALSAKLTGSGDLDASSLKANEVTVDSTGSANSRVFAFKEINVHASGSGDVTIYGNPLKRSVNRSGSADIHWQ
jgi:hypothetical protein